MRLEKEQQKLYGAAAQLYLSTKGRPTDVKLITEQQIRLRQLLEGFIASGEEEQTLGYAGPLLFSQLLEVAPENSELERYLQIIHELEPDKETPLLHEVVSSFDDIIVLLGKKASGKGTISGILEKDYGIQNMPTSDWLRAIANVRGYDRPFDSVMLRELGDDLRDSFGSSVLVELTLREYQLKEHKRIVFDGLRSEKEMIDLVDKPNVFLIWVNAPDKKRLERVILRNRPGDPKTVEDLLAVDQKSFPEAEKLKEMCHQVIANPGDDQDVLKGVIDRLMEQMEINKITEIPDITLSS